jgi:hypothetical protein
MIINHMLATYIILLLQRDAQIWEKLLYATGGKLEISKCNFAFDHLGRATLQKNNNQSLHITASDTKTTMTVPQLSHTIPYKYVGVQIALDGNMDKQITILQEKCNTIAGALSQVFMSSKDTQQGYTTVFIPSICYLLPATSIAQKTLNKLQIPVINNVLTKIGYN